MASECITIYLQGNLKFEWNQTTKQEYHHHYFNFSFKFWETFIIWKKIFLHIWTVHFARVTCHNYTQDKFSFPLILVIFQMPTQKVFSSVYRLTWLYPVASKPWWLPLGPHTHDLAQIVFKERRQNAHALALTKLYNYGKLTVHSPSYSVIVFFSP